MALPTTTTGSTLPFTTTTKPFPDKDAAKIWMVRNQWARRNLTPFQLGELGMRVKHLIAEENRKRQLSTLTNVGQTIVTQQIGEREYTTRHDSETLGQIAAESGVSRETLRRIEHIQKAEREGRVEHSVVAALRDKNSKVSIGKVFSDIRTEEKKAERQAENVALTYNHTTCPVVWCGCQPVFVAVLTVPTNQTVHWVNSVVSATIGFISLSLIRG